MIEERTNAFMGYFTFLGRAVVGPPVLEKTPRRHQPLEFFIIGETRDNDFQALSDKQIIIILGRALRACRVVAFFPGSCPGLELDRPVGAERSWESTGIDWELSARRI